MPTNGYFEFAQTMDWVENWKEMFEFVNGVAEPLTDAAPLNGAARAILKECQKQQKKKPKKGAKGAKVARIV